MDHRKLMELVSSQLTPEDATVPGPQSTLNLSFQEMTSASSFVSHKHIKYDPSYECGKTEISIASKMLAKYDGGPSKAISAHSGKAKESQKRKKKGPILTAAVHSSSASRESGSTSFKGDEFNATFMPVSDENGNSRETASVGIRRSRNPPVSGWKFIPATYRPDPLKSIPVCMLPSNSSPRVRIFDRLVINPKGYNLARANYPAQCGSWYYEVKITHAPKLIELILDAQTRKNETQGETLSKTKDVWFKPYQFLLGTLQEMSQLMDSSGRRLPDPHWRIGWATDMADVECPVGTDNYGYSWRDDGSLFHLARPYLSNAKIEQVNCSSDSASSEPKLSTRTNPPKNDSYTEGDVLGFGIVLPKENLKYVYSLWNHHCEQKLLQDHLIKLRNEWLDLHAHIQHTVVSIPPKPELEQKFRRELYEVEAQIEKIKPLPMPELPSALQGTKMTFWKNGVCQKVQVLDMPPGGYFPAISLYYLAGAVVNFGPEFEYPPPDGYCACSELSNAYEIPRLDNQDL